MTNKFHWLSKIFIGLDTVSNRFSQLSKLKLLLLAIAMVLLWLLAVPSVLTIEEQKLWNQVRAAQLHLVQWRQQQGFAPQVDTDPWQYGLVGVEWSPITTTLGDLSAKRTASNPVWAIQLSRWFQELELKPGDPVAIFSSGSFPGLVLNALVAVETMGLEPLLIVSLGSSTWGANHMDCPWPVIASELRRKGFIRHRADFYTLGGGIEMGHGLSPEGLALLQSAATKADVKLLTALNLSEMISRKTELLKKYSPKLFINIGGSHANLGDDDKILNLPPGLVTSSEATSAGNGVIGHAIRNNIPVIHMLNLKALSRKLGIPYDTPPRKKAPVKIGWLWSLLGIIFYLTVLLKHERWRLEIEE